MRDKQGWLIREYSHMFGIMSSRAIAKEVCMSHRTVQLAIKKWHDMPDNNQLLRSWKRATYS